MAFPDNYNRLFIPRQKTKDNNGLKTLNSKAVGRLLAAGGIYNGNIEGFRETANKLGGDAPAGYDQVMDNKGLLIAGASIVAGVVLGRMRFLIWNHLSISEPEEQYQEDHLIPTLPVVQ